jgi:hypothetical protein
MLERGTLKGRLLEVLHLLSSALGDRLIIARNSERSKGAINFQPSAITNGRNPTRFGPESRLSVSSLRAKPGLDFADP